VGGTFLDFTTGTPGGTCGNTLDGSNVLIKNLTCGGLNLGSSFSLIPEDPTPDGSTSLFALTCAVGGGACDGSCSGSVCNIGPTSTAPPVNSAGPDCTDVGCNFGTPLPIPSPSIPSLTTCELNTWASPASGTLDLSSGTSSTNVALSSDLYLTGNLTQPCPKCVAGLCDRGPRAGMACTATSSTGYTRDCPTGGVGSVATPCPPPGNPACAPTNCPCTPGGGQCCDGSHVGPIAISLTPLTTGTASATDPGGLFCPGQTAAQVGCFGSTACRTINESGVAAGPIFTGVPADATLASVFCIPATGEDLLDAVFGRPGPAAIALPGTFLVGQIDMTGLWTVSFDIGLVLDASFTQTGTALSSTLGSGTIDPASGIFHVETPVTCTRPVPPFEVQGISTIDATVSPDGLTFSGAWSTLARGGPPGYVCFQLVGSVQGVRAGASTTTTTTTVTTTTATTL
jgi:hypothetical protein